MMMKENPEATHNYDQQTIDASYQCRDLDCDESEDQDSCDQFNALTLDHEATEHHRASVIAEQNILEENEDISMPAFT